MLLYVSNATVKKVKSKDNMKALQLKMTLQNGQLERKTEICMSEREVFLS